MWSGLTICKLNCCFAYHIVRIYYFVWIILFWFVIIFNSEWISVEYHGLLQMITVLIFSVSLWFQQTDVQFLPAWYIWPFWPYFTCFTSSVICPLCVSPIMTPRLTEKFSWLQCPTFILLSVLPSVILTGWLYKLCGVIDLWKICNSLCGKLIIKCENNVVTMWSL